MGAGGKEGMEGFPRIFRSGVRPGTYAAEGERRSGIRLGGRGKLGEIKSGVGEDFGQVEFVGKREIVRLVRRITIGGWRKWKW